MKDGIPGIGNGNGEWECNLIATASSLQSHLKPELPEDMALHLHVSSAMLVLTVLTVSQSPKPGPTHQGQRVSGAKTDEGDTTSWIGATL